MKNIIIASLCVMLGLITGCKNIPTESTVQATSYACGVVAGYSTELTGVESNVRDSVAKVLDTASTVVPDTNTSFTVAWTPVIESEVAKLVESGKLSDKHSSFVKNAATTVTKGIDYLFDRHQNWREYQNIVSVAVNGFISGYKSVINPTMSVAPTNQNDIIKEDVEEYKKYLSTTK